MYIGDLTDCRKLILFSNKILSYEEMKTFEKCFILQKTRLNRRNKKKYIKNLKIKNLYVEMIKSYYERFQLIIGLCQVDENY